MIFTLTSVCKEWLDGRNEAQVEVARPASDLSLTESLHLQGDGTPVTPENYALWWAAFLKEKEPLTPIQNLEKLTGKVLFAAKQTPGLVPTAPPDPTATESAQAVDWSLFSEDDEALVAEDEIEDDLNEEDSEQVDFLELHGEL
jgi:hypothetical protein